MRSLCSTLFVGLVALLHSPASSHADVEARVDVSAQRMIVYVSGVPVHDWDVSTGRAGYDTPRGNYRAKRMAARYFSRKYDWAPMPHAIFFTGGYAVHGTSETRKLGRPASHGCVRLHPANAARLFGLVREYGLGRSRIVITN